MFTIEIINAYKQIVSGEYSTLIIENSIDTCYIKIINGMFVYMDSKIIVSDIFEYDMDIFIINLSIHDYKSILLLNDN